MEWGSASASTSRPFYELHLGGRVNGTAKIGQMVVKLPAKSVSAAITHLIDVYRRDRLSGEGLPAFIDRVGKVKLKDELIPYTIVPSFQDDSTFYYDWEGEEEFVLGRSRTWRVRRWRA